MFLLQVIIILAGFLAIVWGSCNLLLKRKVEFSVRARHFEDIISFAKRRDVTLWVCIIRRENRSKPIKDACEVQEGTFSIVSGAQFNARSNEVTVKSLSKQKVYCSSVAYEPFYLDEIRWISMKGSENDTPTHAFPEQCIGVRFDSLGSWEGGHKPFSWDSKALYMLLRSIEEADADAGEHWLDVYGDNF